MPSLMRVPGYQRLVCAMALNQTGYAMAAVVVPLLIFDVTGNPTLTGLVSGLGTGALVLLSLLSGAVTDRLHASKVLRVVALAQAIVWFAIAGMLIFGAVPIWAIAVLVIFAAALGAFDAPSEQSLIKQIVAPNDLGSANAVAHGRESAAEVLGGPFAGFLYAFGPQVALLVQGCAHGLASILVPPKSLVSQNRKDAEPDENSETIINAAVEGFRFVLRHPGLRGITLVAAVANIPMSAFILLLILSFRASGSNAFVIGLISASFGLGVIVGSFFAGALTKRIPLGRLGALALACFSGGLLLLTMVNHNVAATIVVLFIAGLPLASFNSAIGAYTAAVTPESQMGAVTTASTVPGIFLMPLGIFFAGFGFDQWGVTVSMAILAVVSLAATALTFLHAPLRSIPLLSDLDDQI
ncbi:MFS transporter [Corynebacterium sp.]|uniref:MFS transporter n=1 Tax=Corynebacterium sp. TaxID=1720 RepID=UPI0026474EB5|nr:MFS transporter [Corynebacterium sp.]MDN6136335.1 MFS transporter [Corynebacterium sp.]